MIRVRDPKRGSVILKVLVIPMRVLFAALFLAGCGTSEEPRAAEPTPVSKDVAECREQWRDLGETVADRVEGETPSSLASRWTSLVASRRRSGPTV